MNEITIPINASSLSLLVCDTRYFLTVVKGLVPIIEDPILATGKAIHRYAELRARGMPELEILQSTVTLPRVESNHVMLAANGYTSSPLAQPALINGEPAVEINFDIPYERFVYNGVGYTIRFVGTIDRITDDGHFLDLVDFKTSRKKMLDDITADYHNAIQFSFYYYIARTFARQIFPNDIAERIEKGNFSFRLCVVMLSAGGKWLPMQRHIMTDKQFAEFDSHLHRAVNEIKLIWTSQRTLMSGYIKNQCPKCRFAGICHADNQHEKESAMAGFNTEIYSPLTW